MMKYLFTGLIIGSLATWALMSIKSGVTVQTNRNSDTLDAHFIEQMIPHHEDAITMSRLAKTKTKTPEILQLAEDIIDSQQKEIDQMKDWYSQWFGRKVPEDKSVMRQHEMMGGVGMHMGTLGGVSDLSQLQNSKDFNIAFTEQMIPHHLMAVMMANMLKDGTSRPELKQLAENIITTQTREIDQMRDWLRIWK